MSERKRNDLYYIERMSGAMAIHPDGTVGQIEEKKVGAVKTVKGRRADRPRVVTYEQTMFVETELYESAAAYRAEDRARVNAKIKEQENRLYDNSWTLEDMPDRVIAKFNEWKDALSAPEWPEIVQISASMLATKEDLETATYECPWCKKLDPKYACRACDYSKSFFKYPVIRLNDDEGPHDMAFDVAWYLQTSPTALSYEIEPVFSREGNMSATQYAVLRIDEIDGTFTGNDRDHTMHVDKADELYGEIKVPIAAWQENARAPLQPEPFAGGNDLSLLIEEFQRACALDKARERTDTPEYQELYDQFIGKLRALGKAAMTPVLELRYEGMGETGYYMSFGHLPFARAEHNVVASSASVRWLIENVLSMIDEKRGTINFRWEGGF